MNNREKLETLGCALYGARWQNSVLRDICVNARTFERMVAGSAPIPDGIISDLLAIAGERRAVIDNAITLVCGRLPFV